MKKIKIVLFVIAVLFLFPFMVHAKDANVIIDKVTLESKTDGVEIIEEPTIDGLVIDFGLEFSEVGDKVVYKADFINKDQEDYELKLPEAKSDGYVIYSYQFQDNSSILKANSSKSLIITVEYKDEVPDSALQNGKYSEKNQVKLTLLTDDKEVEVVNPKTGQSILFIAFVSAILLGSAYVIFKNHKNSKTIGLLFLVGIMALPFSIYALKQLSVTINTRIEIAKIKDFCVLDYSTPISDPGHDSIDRVAILKMVGNGGNSNTFSYTFKTGDTILDYMKKNENFVSTFGSPLNPNYVFIRGDEQGPLCEYNVVIFYSNEELEEMYSGNQTSTNPGTFQNGDSIIQDSSIGCYFIASDSCNNG